VVIKWLVRSYDTVLSYPARTESQNVTFSGNIVYRVYDSFCLFAYAGSLKRVCPQATCGLSVHFIHSYSQILFQLCNVARVSVEDFFISDYFFILSSGTKCLGQYLRHLLFGLSEDGLLSVVCF
jgi:hypothetical protein